MSIDWSQGGGLSPRIIPSTEPLPPAKRDNSKLILYALLGVMLLVIALLVIPKLMPSQTDGNPGDGSNSTIAKVAADNENRGRAATYRELAAKIDGGEIVGMKAVVEFVKGRTANVKNESFGVLIKKQNQYNGERWDAAAMAELSREFAEGFERAGE